MLVTGVALYSFAAKVAQLLFWVARISGKGAFDSSMQHHLIEICSVKVVLT